jgi:hypothetical protein
MDLGTPQNNIQTLPDLSNFRYENIFRLYQTKDNHYFYNILSTVSFPDNLDDNLFYNVVVNEKTPWPVISYGAYGTIELWWLLAIINGVKNPFEIPSNNTLKVLKAQYVRPVITQLNQLVK